MFDIAFLTDKQVSHFHSDFKIVADYFVHHRKNADYKPASPQKFKHADELLKLFSVLAGDSRFAMTLKDKKGGKPETMWEAIDRSEAKGFEKGEKKLADLITKLLAANRNDDIAKAISSIPFRNKLYKEFQIT